MSSLAPPHPPSDAPERSSDPAGAGRRRRPPRSARPGRQRSVGAPLELLSLGAAVGLAVMTAVGTGDALLAGVLVGLVASDVAAGTAGVLVGISVVGRWGSSSLAALAGGQAVFGAAGWTGSPEMMLSSWAAAAAVVLACPHRPTSAATADRRPALRAGTLQAVAAIGCGTFAAALVAGPAVAGDTARVVGLRVVASVVATAAALVLARACPLRVARVAGLIAAASAAAIAVLA